MARMLRASNTATLGYRTWAWMPYSSITASRLAGSEVAGSVSSHRRGWYGAYSCHPAMAAAPTAPRRWSPMNQASSRFASSQRTCGTRSPQRLDMRDVHRSGGSTTWVSTSTMGMSEMDVVNSGVLLCSIRTTRPGECQWSDDVTVGTSEKWCQPILMRNSGLELHGWRAFLMMLVWG